MISINVTATSDSDSCRLQTITANAIMYRVITMIHRLTDNADHITGITCSTGSTYSTDYTGNIDRLFLFFSVVISASALAPTLAPTTTSTAVTPTPALTPAATTVTLTPTPALTPTPTT